MKMLKLMFFLFLTNTLFAQESAHFGAAKFAPADGKKLLIAGQDLGAVGGLNTYTNGYVDHLPDYMPTGVTTYTSIPGLGGLTDPDNWGAGDVHAQAYLEDETFDHTVIAIGLHMVNQLANISSGQHDASIIQLAEWIKNTNRPVFLRIGYEFEGSWNNYNPTQFIAAWKHIVHLFDAEEVWNVAYVWQSAGTNAANIAQWYPGDDYVNWLAYSHFDGPNPGQSIRNFALDHDKPIMIAEATPRVNLGQGNGEDHWNNWFQPLFDRVYNDDRIKALAYINVNWNIQPMWQGQGWGDSRVQINPFIKLAWENEMEKDLWIEGDENLFDLLNMDHWNSNEIIIPTMQTINFPAGWSMFSSYMIPDDLNLKNIFDPLDQITIIKDNAGLAYLPEWDFNAIGNILIGQGYHIKTTEACSIDVYGTYAFPEAHSININSGWNKIGYLRIEPADIALVLNELNTENNLIIAKDYFGNAYLPELNYNGIGKMQAGQGYQLKVMGSTSLSYLSNDASY